MTIGIGERCRDCLLSIDLKKYKIVINAGVCGSVNPQLNLFETIIPSKITLTTKSSTVIPLNIPDNINAFKKNLTLGTSPEPVLSKTEKEKLYSLGIDIIDMECFFIAEKYPYVIPIKVVTDTPETSENLKSHLSNIGKGLEILKNQTAKIIEMLIENT